MVFEPNFLTPKPNAASYLVLLQNQVRKFAELGNEVSVLAENSFQVQHVDGQNISIHPLRGMLTWQSSLFSMANKAISYGSGFFSPDIIQKAVKTVNKLQPDIIYSCGTSFSSLFSAMLGRITGIPVVHYVFEFNGAWNWWRGDIDTMHGFKVPITYSIHQFVNTMPRELIRRDFLHKWALRNVTKLIACSDYVKKALNNFVSDLSDVSVIYPGVDIPSLADNPKNISFNPESIAYLGHLWQGRGVLDLAMAFSHVIKHHPKAKLLIASTNVHALTEYYLEKIINEHKLRHNILRIGKVENVYREILLPSSAIVLPYRDTPSVKLLECMAVSKPVVTTNVGWIPELISNGVNGFFTNIGEVKKIAEKLDLLLNNPEFGKEIGKKARMSIKEKCDLTRNTTNIVKILKKVSNKGSK